MILDQYPKVRELSPADKLTLANELWEDPEVQSLLYPMSEEHKALLDQREEEYLRDPSRVTTWGAIKDRLLGSVPAK